MGGLHLPRDALFRVGQRAAQLGAHFDMLQPLAAAGCAGYWFPSNPSTGMAWALRGTR